MTTHEGTGPSALGGAGARRPSPRNEEHPQPDVATFAVATYDDQGRCLEANAAWMRLHGLTTNAVAQQTWFSAVEPADHGLAVAALERVGRGMRCDVKLHALRPDGTPFAFEATLVPRRGAGGDAGGFHAFEHAVERRAEHAGPDANHRDMGSDTSSDDGAAVSPGAAARALGVSVSTIRRWIDDGRLHASRTAGGHRRIAEDELRRFGASLTRPTRLKRPRLPEGPLPALAFVLTRRGEELLTEAARICYEDGAAGWFAQERSRAFLQVWIRRLARAAEAGVPEDAVGASRDMFAEARAGAGLEECQVFVDRFSALALRALTPMEDSPRALADARSLLAAMRRTLASWEDERT